MIGVLSDKPPRLLRHAHGSLRHLRRRRRQAAPHESELAAQYPNLHTIAATLRRVHTANVNDWGALCWHKGSFHRSRNYPRFDILDRIGAGDSSVAGLIHGLLVENDAQKAVDYGAAHGALAMTTPGTPAWPPSPEVQKLAEGGDAKVQR